MLQLLHANLANTLFVLLLISRLGDIGTTYWVTPNLSLEANPIARKLGWKFAFLTLLVCLVPYLSPQLGLTFLMMSLLVSASNAAKMWTVRTMGEQAFQRLMLDLARRSRLSSALLGIGVSCFFIVLAGGVILFFYPRPAVDWGYWIGLGVIADGVAVGMWGSLSAIRLFRNAAHPRLAGAGK